MLSMGLILRMKLIGGSNMDKRILFVLFLFLIPNVLALGITPGRNTMDFVSNLERDVGFTVVNTEGKAMNVAFTVEGDLASYISLENTIESFLASDGSKDFSYKISLPFELAPGLHKADIVVTELPRDIGGDNVVIAATVSVVHQVYVHVPFPGKYIEAALDVVSRGESNLIDFYVPVVSRGDEAIGSVSAVIDIYKGSEKVANVSTNVLAINPQERKELSAVWNPEVAPGKYKAVARINYDGEEKVVEKDFGVGNSSLLLVGIGVNDFRLGEVARIRVLVQNVLNDDIENAFAKFEVYDFNLKRIADLKSEDYRIPASSIQEFVLYWDTEDLDKGQYDSTLDINFDEKLLSKNFKIDVGDDSMSFVGIGFVVAGERGKISVTSILWIVIGVLVLLNLIWLVWWMGHKKKKKS